MFSVSHLEAAQSLITACRAGQLRLAVAESCTGGLLAALLTEVAGASDVFDRGFVTYSNEAKTELLGVDASLIQTHGAVSELVSLQMAEGALARSNADVSIAITGIAGPAGGSVEKPVGLVHFGCAKVGSNTLHDQEIFSGSRSDIRQDAVRHALRLLASRL